MIPAMEPDHDVMTVFSIERIAGIRMAYCNWVVGPKQTMHRRQIAVDFLQRVRRACDVD